MLVKWAPVIFSVFGEKALTSWWHHQMETFSALLALCEGNPPVTGGVPSQRPVIRGFDGSFDQCGNKWLDKQSDTGDLRYHLTHYDVTVMIDSLIHICMHQWPRLGRHWFRQSMRCHLFGILNQWWQIPKGTKQQISLKFESLKFESHTHIQVIVWGPKQSWSALGQCFVVMAWLCFSVPISKLVMVW